MSDSATELEKVKQDVRSLLISAPNGLTPKMLEKDYAAVMGQPLPFRKFGFFNSTDFLRSLTDILRVSFQQNQILLFGIADKSTEHIMKLVKKQKKPKFYSSITSTQSQQQPTSSKNKFRPSPTFPSALTREGVLKVLNKYPDGFSMMKLHEYYQEVNGTKLEIKRTDEIPGFILKMGDIARLDFGRKEKSGNNVYIFPSKTLLGYQKFRVQNFRSDSQPPKLSHPPGLSSVSKSTNTSTISSTVQSWVNSVSSCVKVTSSHCTSITSTSTVSHLSHLNTKTESISSTSVPKVSASRPPRFQKLSSTTSSGIMSQTSSSSSGTYSESDKTRAKSVIDAKHNDNDTTLLIEDATPPESALLKREIVELLGECNSEVRATKVPSMFKKKYSKDLDLHSHGYYGIIDLISTMTDQISMCRLNRTGDWLLKLRRAKSDKAYDAKGKGIDKGAILGNVEREFKELLKKYHGGIAVESLEDLYEMHFERSLPLQDLGLHSAIQLVTKITDTLILKDDQLCLQSASACDTLRNSEPSTFCAPLDAIGYGIRYKSPLLPSIDWGFFECYVTFVNNPSDFRIQIIAEETTGAFNTLMDDIERTYCHTDAKVYRIPPHLIVPGQICVAIYHGDNNWNRAVIVKAPSGGFVQVRYVDYGDIASVSTGAVYYLKRKYFDLPILEVHARLANIRPARANQWEIGAKKALLDFSKNKSLVAKVTAEEDRGGNKIFSLEICDVSTGDDIYINDILLRKRLAALEDDVDDLTPAEIDHIFAKKDIPADSPPPYQATETIPPLVNSTEPTPSAMSLLSSSLPSMPPLSVPAPPPGFGNLLPSREAPLEISRLIESLSGTKTKKLADGSSVLTESKELVKKSSSKKEQKRYLKLFRLTDKLSVHVINFKGTAMLLSGEISRIFRPDMSDMLAPLLMMKNIREEFPELVLACNSQSEQLFCEFEKLKVKDAFKSEGLLCSVVCLYRLTDVPEIVSELGHTDEALLVRRLGEIITMFNPDDPYWYRDPTTCIGSRSDASSSESNSTFCNASASASTVQPLPGVGLLSPPPGLNYGDGGGSSIAPEARMQLNERRDELLKQLLSSNNPSPRIFNELKDVMTNIGQINNDVQKVLDSGDAQLKLLEDSSADMCAIPAEQNATAGSVFSEIRQSCDELLHNKSFGSSEDISDIACADINNHDEVATNLSLQASSTFSAAESVSSEANSSLTVWDPVSVASFITSSAVAKSTLSVTNSSCFTPLAVSTARSLPVQTRSAASAGQQQPTVLSILSNGSSTSPIYQTPTATLAYTLQPCVYPQTYYPANMQASLGWPTSSVPVMQQTVFSLRQQTEVSRVFPFFQ